MLEGNNVVLNLEAWVGSASPRPPSWAIGHTELSAGGLGTARPTSASGFRSTSSLRKGGISEAAWVENCILKACLRFFPFRKELGRPSLLRSADVTSKAKGWSSLPVLWFGGEKPRRAYARSGRVGILKVGLSPRILLGII